ncbi:MAG: hypothetical protein PVI11_01500 [Candidatus Aminicenantes bacterium]
MKKFILASILILIIAVPQSLHAQWAKLYGGSNDDWANSVQQTSDGGYIAAGYTESFGEELSDIWVVKLSFAGDTEWQRTYGGLQNEEAYSIQETSDGGYIVAGYTDSFGLGNTDIWVLKLTPEGDIEWQRTFGGSGDDWANSIQQTSDGGYIIGGSSDSFGNGEVGFLVIKVSSKGNVEWQDIYSPFVNGYLRSIRETSDGGYIIAGHISPSLNNSFDLLIFKLDSMGLIEWQRYFGGSQNDWANGIQETDDGGFFVAGYTESFGAGNLDFWVLKLTSIGRIDWEKAYGGSGDDWANSAQQTSDGGFIVAGASDSFGAGFSDFWLLKLSSSGNIEWQKPYGDTGDEAAFSIAQTDDGGYVVAGNTDSTSAGDLDIMVLKIYSGGAIDPSCALPGSSSASITTTGATFFDTYMSPWDTSIVPQITDVIPLESDSDTFLVCEERLEIAGSVKTEGDVGIEGVTITFSGGEGEATTDADGNYSHSVSYGWTGTATPSMTGYGFTPSSREYTEVTSDQANEDYTGFIVHIISGFVRTGGGDGIEEVTITFSNDGGEVLTAADGSYSHAVKEGWSGTATPSKNCYSFVPPSRGYINVSSDHTNQDYTGTFLTYTISGTIQMASTSAPLSGVVLSGLPGNPVTDASGYYEATVDCGWTGTVIPTLLRHVFSPVSQDYEDVHSDHTNQDYAAYPAWIISGLVTTAEGEGMAGVSITFSDDGGAGTTGMDGSYSHAVIEGWSGTATPSMAGYVFTPSSRDYTNVTSDIPDQDYTGEVLTYTMTILVNEGGTTQPAPGSYTHIYGTEIEIRALPDEGYDFSRWSGDVFSGLEKVNPVLVIMDSDRSITAQFEKQKLCFIATAAYGTPSHPHVKILRDFRDRYLVRSYPGRWVIEFYYRHSPLVANLISRHAVWRAAVRIHLLPLVAMSFVALRLGPGISASVLFLIFVFPLFLVSFQKRKRKHFIT